MATVNPMDGFATALRKHGFRADNAGAEGHLAAQLDAGADQGGPYQVHGRFRHPDGLTVTIEQNTDGMGRHDPIAVITGPLGPVAVNLADEHLDIDAALAAVTDPEHQADTQ